MKTPEILFCDGGAVVVVKPAGVISEDAGEGSMPLLLERLLAERGTYEKVLPVHRLDRAVGGLMVYALGTKAAAVLTRQISEGAVAKEYFAVVHGAPENQSGEFCDLLYHDQKKNKTYVVDRMRHGVREAKLMYRLAGTEGQGTDQLSLVSIRLITGRTHQIRAQFSNKGMPLWGDARYGSPVRGGEVALWSARLSFKVHLNGEVIDIRKNPPDVFPWNMFGCETYKCFNIFGG